MSLMPIAIKNHGRANIEHINPHFYILPLISKPGKTVVLQTMSLGDGGGGFEAWSGCR